MIEPAEPLTRTSAGPDLGVVLTLVWRIGIAVSVATLGLFAWAGARPWRLGVVGAVVVGLAAAMRPGPRALYRNRPRLALLLIFTLQGAIVCATGGIESPFIVILLPPAVLAGLLTARWRSALSVLVYPLGLVMALAWLRHAGLADGLVPAVLDRTLASSGSELARAIYAVMLAVVLLGSGVLGAKVRAALDASYARASRFERELSETLADRNKEILGLSGALTHELKNPLAAIQGLATLLARRTDRDDREAQQVRVLVSEIKRMGSVVDEFLGFARPLSELAVAPAGLEALAKEIALLHEPVAAERNVRVKVSDNAEVFVECDPRKVKQILVNILQNALDVAPSGSTVTFELQAREHGATLWVDDEGPGLDPAVRARLFTPGVTSKPEGSGLGLTIARTLAEQHGGTLSLEERAGHGCRAALTLPRRPPSMARRAPLLGRSGEAS